MFCTRLFLTHNDTTSMTCCPSKWAGKYVHRPLYISTGHGASLSSILVSVSLNTNRHIFAAKQDSTIFPANRIWIRHHIHHHFLWLVFPVCKGFEINLKEKMGNIMGMASLFDCDILIKWMVKSDQSSTFLRCSEKIFSLFLYISCCRLVASPPSPHTSTSSTEASTGK